MTDQPPVAAPPHGAGWHGLPVPRTRLFGRESEIVEICRLLDAGGPVTITGQGGIGKTRVAIEVSPRQRRRVVFVQLADVDRSAVAGAISAPAPRKGPRCWPGPRPTHRPCPECGPIWPPSDPSSRRSGAIEMESGSPVLAAAVLRDAITQAQQVDYDRGKVYCCLVATVLACRIGRWRDAADLDDAFRQHPGVRLFGLPPILISDYTAAVMAARAATGRSTAAPAQGRGWGWLRVRVLNLVGEIAATATADEGGSPSVTTAPRAAADRAGPALGRRADRSG